MMETFFNSASLFSFAQAIPFSFAALIPVLNPLGSAVIFLTMTYGAPRQELNALALKVAINTFVLLLSVLLTGSWILSFFGITIPIVQVGGGLVVAYIGWNLLNQPASQSKKNDTLDTSQKNIKDMAFFPLTMPITAGPGSIAVALTIGAHEKMKPSLGEYVFGEIGSIVGIILCAITVFFCYRYANTIGHKLGPSGTEVIMRLAAFINLCIGLTILWRGLQGLAL